MVHTVEHLNNGTLATKLELVCPLWREVYTLLSILNIIKKRLNFFGLRAVSIVELESYYD